MTTTFIIVAIALLAGMVIGWESRGNAYQQGWDACNESLDWDTTE